MFFIVDSHLEESRLAETMHIGELAELAGTTTRTVRFYEEKGLIEPCHRSSGGFRCYSDEQLGRMRMILSLKELGFDLDKIKSILTKRNQDETAGKLAADVLTDLRTKLEELNRQISEMQEVRDKVECTISSLCHCLPCELRLEERLCEDCERLRSHVEQCVPFFHTIQSN
jgi:DNA-binding transcriptional MerR regulator